MKLKKGIEPFSVSVGGDLIAVNVDTASEVLDKLSKLDSLSAYFEADEPKQNKKTDEKDTK